MNSFSKKFFLIAVLFLPVSAAAGSLAPQEPLDKAGLALHVRKAFNLDPQFDIQVGDPAESMFTQFSSVTVTFGPYSQSIFITKDGRYYIWGNLYDTKIDPDLDRMGKIKLTGAHAKGPQTAPVTVVVYSDIQCPNCKYAHQTVNEKLFQDFPADQVRLVFKHFPLSMHPWAEKAAVATECAAEQKSGQFWKMLDSLYEEAPQISTGTIHSTALRLAKDMKLNTGKFEACLDDPKMVVKVQGQKSEGMEAGVSATPTFLVNGRQIRGNNYNAVKAVIEEKLKGRQK